MGASVGRIAVSDYSTDNNTGGFPMQTWESRVENNGSVTCDEQGH
jgi:hypothetical protein